MIGKEWDLETEQKTNNYMKSIHRFTIHVHIISSLVKWRVIMLQMGIFALWKDRESAGGFATYHPLSAAFDMAEHTAQQVYIGVHLLQLLCFI